MWASRAALDISAAARFYSSTGQRSSSAADGQFGRPIFRHPVQAGAANDAVGGYGMLGLLAVVWMLAAHIKSNSWRQLRQAQRFQGETAAVSKGTPPTKGMFAPARPLPKKAAASAARAACAARSCLRQLTDPSGPGGLFVLTAMGRWKARPRLRFEIPRGSAMSTQQLNTPHQSGGAAGCKLLLHALPPLPRPSCFSYLQFKA